MPKGRVNVPSTANDGNWFQHRGLPEQELTQWGLTTCTARMLSAPFHPDTSGYPPFPPIPYRNKDAKNFKDTNKFSRHDNRHSFQDQGIYFGDGRWTRHLGKYHIESAQRQHHTDKHFLKHLGRQVIDHDYNTINATDYQGKATAEPPRHRRYTCNLPEGRPGLAKLSTGTTLWHDDPNATDAAKFRTPLHVLAITQEPLLPENLWKYSNHSLAKCYPSYDHINKRKDPYAVWHLDAPNVATANSTWKALTVKD